MIGKREREREREREEEKMEENKTTYDTSYWLNLLVPQGLIDTSK